MTRNRDKVVGYWLGLAVGVTAVLFALGADRVRAGDDRADEKLRQLQAELDKTKKEAEELAAKNRELTAALEKARRDALAAQNAEKLARQQAEDSLKRLEGIAAELVKLRGGVPLRPAPALPDGVRGKVTDVAGDQITLSIGIDAGLAVSSTLDLYRTEGGGRYLGTVKVVDAKNLFPKTAIATFTPARKAKIEDLKPDELPKKGDEARPQLDKTRDR